MLTLEVIKWKKLMFLLVLIMETLVSQDQEILILKLIYYNIALSTFRIYIIL